MDHQSIRMDSSQWQHPTDGRKQQAWMYRKNSDYSLLFPKDEHLCSTLAHTIQCAKGPAGRLGWQAILTPIYSSQRVKSATQTHEKFIHLHNILLITVEGKKQGRALLDSPYRLILYRFSQIKSCCDQISLFPVERTHR